MAITEKEWRAAGKPFSLMLYAGPLLTLEELLGRMHRRGNRIVYGEEGETNDEKTET